MKITTVDDKMNVTYEHRIKQPKQTVKEVINESIAKNLRIKISRKRFIKHPLIRKHSHIPFNN